jgi:hypothetical protein
MAILGTPVVERRAAGPEVVEPILVGAAVHPVAVAAEPNPAGEAAHPVAGVAAATIQIAAATMAATLPSLREVEITAACPPIAEPMKARVSAEN